MITKGREFVQSRPIYLGTYEYKVNHFEGHLESEAPLRQSADNSPVNHNTG